MQPLFVVQTVPSGLSLTTYRRTPLTAKLDWPIVTESFQLLQRRFGDERPGMQLLAVEEAAIPVTIVQADVLAQERKPLPIIEEFLLRMIAAGVGAAQDTADMLGLERAQVLEAAASQVSDNNLRLRTDGDLSLTAQG